MKDFPDLFPKARKKLWEDFKNTRTKTGRYGKLSPNNEKNDEMDCSVKLHEAWEVSCILDSGASSTVLSSKMIDNIVAQGVTVTAITTLGGSSVRACRVGQLVDVHSTVRWTLEIKLDHRPICLRNLQYYVVSGVETVLIGRSRQPSSNRRKKEM